MMLFSISSESAVADFFSYSFFPENRLQELKNKAKINSVKSPNLHFILIKNNEKL